MITFKTAARSPPMCASVLSMHM